jgi:hypothetical protein
VVDGDTLEAEYLLPIGFGEIHVELETSRTLESGLSRFRQRSDREG